MKIVLVGEDHFDLDAGQRVREALRRYKPRLIALEMTEREYSASVKTQSHLHPSQKLELEVKLRDAIAKSGTNLNIDTTLRFIENCDAPDREISAYCLKSGASISFCRTQDAQELMGKMTGKSESRGFEVLSELLCKSIDEIRLDVARAYSSNSFPVKDLPELVVHYTAMDKVSEEIIRLSANIRQGTLLHLCGLDHIYGDYYNLYDRLSDLQPIRMKLADFEVTK